MRQFWSFLPPASSLNLCLATTSSPNLEKALALPKVENTTKGGRFRIATRLNPNGAFRLRALMAVSVNLRIDPVGCQNSNPLKSCCIGVGLDPSGKLAPRG
jgi:hypothetical protein